MVHHPGLAVIFGRVPRGLGVNLRAIAVATDPVAEVRHQNIAHEHERVFPVRADAAVAVAGVRPPQEVFVRDGHWIRIRPVFARLLPYVDLKAAAALKTLVPDVHDQREIGRPTDDP